ncbi:MAG: hypothetical protein U9Q06_02615 [Nanoarchaeota archaeon]|nr:hypothetical protein [Nanoarchaeota archaeon]
MHIITKEDTSEEKVLEFLKDTNDPNPIHREQKILPGMFALHLIGRKITKPIKGLKIRFQKIGKYPSELNLTTEENEIYTEFTISNNKGLYDGMITYFVKGTSLMNQQKLFSVYQLPGKIQEHLKKIYSQNQIGIYLAQTMDFSNEVNPLEGELIFGEVQEKGKNIILPTDYKKSGKIIAKGTAEFRLTTAKTLERILRIN